MGKMVYNLVINCCRERVLFMLQASLKRSFTCINHLFLCHAMNDKEAFGNDLIEGELNYFLSALEKEDASNDLLFVFKDSLMEEMKVLLSEVSASNLEKAIEESLYIIMGYESPVILNVFIKTLNRCVEPQTLAN